MYINICNFYTSLFMSPRGKKDHATITQHIHIYIKTNKIRNIIL